MSEVKVGTCGFQKSRKRHYEDLDAVEVQQTFYDPPSSERLKSWRNEAPKGFEFTVKAWMLLTHGYNKRLWRRLKRSVPGSPERYGGFRLTEENIYAWEETLSAAEALEARIIVVQTPPSFGPSAENAERIAGFFQAVDTRGYLVVWEPRGAWWSDRRLLYRVAKTSGLYIAGDVIRGRRPPIDQEILYARLHGLGGGEVNYRYKYSDEDLARLRDIVGNGGWSVAYVMFNNVHAYEDALRFKIMIRENTIK